MNTVIKTFKNVLGGGTSRPLIFLLLALLALSLITTSPSYAIAEYGGAEIDITDNNIPEELVATEEEPAPMLRAPMLLGASSSDISGDKSYKVDDSKNATAGFVTFSVGEYEGSCIQKGVEYKKSGTAKMGAIANTSLLAKAAYYVDVQKGWFKNAKDRPKIMDDAGVADRFKAGLLAEDVLQCANQGTSSWSEKAASQTYPQKYINYVVNIVEDTLPGVTVPSGFVIYKGNPSDKSQDFAVWKYTPTGHLTLTKASANPGITG